MSRYKPNQVPITITFQLKPGILKTKLERSIICIISFSFISPKRRSMEAIKKELFDRGLIKENDPHIRRRITSAIVTQKVISVTKSYRRISLSTGLSIPDQFWNKNEKTATGSYENINYQLTILQENIEKLYASLIKLESFKLSPTSFHSEIKKHIFKNNNPTKPLPDFTITSPAGGSEVVPEEFAQYLLWKIEDHKRLGQREKTTITGYRKFRNHVLKFENDVFGEKKLMLNEINDSLLKKAVEWFLLQKNPRPDKFGIRNKPYSLNYFDWWKRTWKLFINEATNEDDIEFQKLNLDKKFMNRKGEAADDIYLSFSQLQKIKEIKFDSDETELEKYRDSFIVNCASGCRWGDHKHQDKIYLDDAGKWHFIIPRTEKNKTTNVKIPVYDKVVIEIFKKYGNKFPTIEVEQTYNKKIQIIALRAGLTNLHRATTINAATRKLEFKEPIPIWKICSSKVARKTAISNWIREYQVPLPIAMSWSNHKSESSFRIYVKLTAEEYFEMASKLMNKLEQRV